MAIVGGFLTAAGTSAGTAAAVGTFATATALQVGLSVVQNKKTEKAQERQTAIEQAQQAEEATRSRRQVVKESITKRAQIENAATATGQQESSAVVAGTQQVGSSAADAIGDINTSLGFNKATSNAAQSVSNASRRSPLQAVAGAVGQAALTFKS